ncbi:antitoxin, partial [Enterococcus durans]
MTTEEVLQMHIQSLQREIDDLEQTKAVMVNETARKAI